MTIFDNFTLTVHKCRGYFHNGNFREFLHSTGGIFDFQNGNFRWLGWHHTQYKHTSVIWYQQ